MRRGSRSWLPARFRSSSQTRPTGNLNALKTTVTVDWVRDRLASESLAILDARSKGAYLRSHIPGALHADLFHYFVPGTDEEGLAKFHEDLAREFGKIGLTGGKTAVVYESGFGTRAARVAWMLEYSGLSKVFLMEGGFFAWQRAGYPWEKKRVKVSAKRFQIRPRQAILATADSIVSRPLHGTLVLDVRSRGEYEGSEKRDCCDRYGRIPRAGWFEWTQFLNSGQGFLRRPAMGESLEKLGLRSDRDVVTYCHRGARAAAAFYALKSLGFTRVRNYIGSWHEWSSRKDLPAETGALPDA